MENKNIITEETEKREATENTKCPVLVRKIGGTKYTVVIHFSKTSKETAKDKLLRIIKNDIANNK